MAKIHPVRDKSRSTPLLSRLFIKPFNIPILFQVIKPGATGISNGIHPGHEVLSLFGISTQALNKKTDNQRLIISLISAFFIVLAVSLILSFSSRLLASGQASAGATASTVPEQPAAFVPGQFITAEINRGYLVK
ncbi:hypothetical protein HYZ76_00420 [Candidatus Falkowbacteria bacterium]|nr:hypothetical protein [Candidatus Falkowbacteria bacterium]